MVPLHLRGLAAVPALASLALAGCLNFGGPVYDMSGSWTSELRVEGTSLRGVMEVDQMGHTMDAVLRVPSLGSEARGGGLVTDQGEVTLELEYDLTCPGTVRLVGTLSEAGARASGEVTAEDCTGVTRGTFELRRQ